jgi:hypothetical protein
MEVLEFNSRTSIKINIDFGITPILECKTMFIFNYHGGNLN